MLLSLDLWIVVDSLETETGTTPKANDDIGFYVFASVALALSIFFRFNF